MVVLQTQERSLAGAEVFIEYLPQTLIDEFHSKVDILGILPVLSKKGARVDDEILKSAYEEFGMDNIFDNKISIMERVKRMDMEGITDNDKDIHDRRVHEIFTHVANEIMTRLEGYGNCMALLDHDKNKNKTTGKKLLTRGPKIEVNSQVNRSDIEKTIPSEVVKENPKNNFTTLSTTVTEPVNIRVDNHIRNRIAAFITMGHSDTQKEMVETLVNLFIEGLEKSDLKRFEDLVDIYEQKYYMKHQKKNNKRK